ncbi:MAG: DUF3830 family protein [Chitinophagia bacterium]|nr:DUF3830 family protein [Chitinophagia bacterium]
MFWVSDSGEPWLFAYLQHKKTCMSGFTITTPGGDLIRFRYYNADAPLSVAAFEARLPFTLSFYHARVSGQEIWRAQAFRFDVIQENASVFTLPGEVVLGPMHPPRNKAGGGAIGIYYGEGRGLDAANIFARVLDEDFSLLQQLGELVWKQGEQPLLFQQWTQ